jgi:uncharacterized protein YqcC (DUF446 family)
LTKVIEVEIDDTGTIRPMAPATSLPHGRALLVWQADPTGETALLSEASLAVDWLRPEEDEAWAYMQPDR